MRALSCTLVSVPVSEITAKSILRKQKRVDSWFLGRYGMNLYRGCAHDCVYCDGRAEKYQVEGTFGRDVAVKINAVDVLTRELDPARKRKPMDPGLIFVGGGVCDSYQAAEDTYRLTRRVLEVLRDRRRPVHMLTKSTRIERDVDILGDINEQTRAIISFSFSTVDDATGRRLEPGVPPPSERLALLERLSSRGFACGVYLLPLVPCITDDTASVRCALQAFYDAGAHFVVAGGMTLKEGRQKEHFFDVARREWPERVADLERIYPSSAPRPYGEPVVDREREYAPVLLEASEATGLPLRAPVALAAPYLSERDRAVIILEQTAYLLSLRGVTSPFGRAAHNLAIAAIPSVERGDIPDSVDALTAIPGIGRPTAETIREIQRTGTSKRYEDLLYPASR